ncbi:hypothetical protein LTS17_006382 [Exophiala oligosperma]
MADDVEGHERDQESLNESPESRGPKRRRRVTDISDDKHANPRRRGIIACEKSNSVCEYRKVAEPPPTK